MKTILFVLAAVVLPSAVVSPAPVTAPRCSTGNGGLSLPEPLCAIVVADKLSSVRQITVTPDGIVYGALRSAQAEGGVVALSDADGDGVAEERRFFGPTQGNDVELREGHLYLALDDRVVRWKLTPGQLVPSGEAEIVVSGLPSSRSHAAKSIAFGRGDTMFVNIGSPSNACQAKDRSGRSPGKLPCDELKTRAGIWAFSASRTGQGRADGIRYATGIRNATALGVDPATSVLWAATHGRDMLTQWGFSDQYNADNPAEELLLVRKGHDFGWPFCYFSHEVNARVTAPEYGGNGKKRQRCDGKAAPALVFPGHWAPLALAFAHRGSPLGPQYDEGLFLAFHGSWNRAPLPQAGYRVVFVPFSNGGPQGTFSVVARGTESDTWLRASGVAVGPDGALFVADEKNGTIWRIVGRPSREVG
jgi:glucose/arabinose dehydrogenase